MFNANAKMGIREICDVVFRAKSTMMVGNQKFYKDEPVLYFDSLKTSSLEGAATTVYATGGKGNSRLVSWEGERTMTFNMEDALISAAGLMILTGAGIVEPKDSDPKLKVHCTERVQLKEGALELNNFPVVGLDVYVMKLDGNGDIASEPYLYKATEGSKTISIKTGDDYAADTEAPTGNAIVLVDYYTEKENAVQINITPDVFGGNFYVEASTLFRNQQGIDLPAEFIIPNCNVQSNFTFNMAATGDPSSFSFVVDAFPDYTKFDKTTKVLAAIQLVTDAVEGDEKRTATVHDYVPG